MEQAIPEILFKYTKVKTAKIILRKGSFRFARASTYNDPLEADRPTDDRASWDKEQWRTFFQRVLCIPDAARTTSDQFADWLQRDRERYIFGDHALKQDIENEYIETFMNRKVSLFDNQQYLNRHMRSWRHFCVSKQRMSGPMWAHYASDHRGVVLSLDQVIMTQALNLRPLAVPYRDALRPFVIGPDAEAESFLYDSRPNDFSWPIQKHSQWSYEEEVRYICPNKSHDSDFEDKSFPPEAIRGVIFGARASTGAIASITRLLRIRYPHATTEQVIVRDGNYSIHPLRTTR